MSGILDRKVENASGLPSNLACRFALANWTGANKCAHCGEPPRGSDYTFPPDIIATLEPHLLRDLMFLRVLACADCIGVVKGKRHKTLGDRRREISRDLIGRKVRTATIQRRMSAILTPSPSGIPDNYPLIWLRAGIDTWQPQEPDDIGQ